MSQKWQIWQITWGSVNEDNSIQWFILEIYLFKMKAIITKTSYENQSAILHNKSTNNQLKWTKIKLYLKEKY